MGAQAKRAREQCHNAYARRQQGVRSLACRSQRTQKAPETLRSSCARSPCRSTLVIVPPPRSFAWLVQPPSLPAEVSHLQPARRRTAQDGARCAGPTRAPRRHPRRVPACAAEPRVHTRPPSQAGTLGPRLACAGLPVQAAGARCETCSRTRRDGCCRRCSRPSRSRRGRAARAGCRPAARRASSRAAPSTSRPAAADAAGRATWVHVCAQGCGLGTSGCRALRPGGSHTGRRPRRARVPGRTSTVASSMRWPAGCAAARWRTGGSTADSRTCVRRACALGARTVHALCVCVHRACAVRVRAPPCRSCMCTVRGARPVS